MKWIRKLWIAVIVLFMAVCAFVFYRLNNKINNLAAAVQVMAEEESDIRLSMIPVLSLNKDGWKITQFGDPDKEQENCYVITTSTGLVILDGGCSYEVPRLRKIIAQYGNTVEAWFLSHPHADHINAFLDIYQDLQGITINHIYTAEHPSVEVMRERASWDDFSAAELFNSLNVPAEYLHTGDELTVLNGLKVKILTAYDSVVEELSDDYLNDGALMLKVSGQRDSMIFCTDVGKAMTDHLVEAYGEELNSDYVQMGHHGNGGPGKAFYQAVKPRGAFFDAPGWIMQRDEKPSAKKKEELISELGAVIYSFYTAPNQIVLE